MELRDLLPVVVLFIIIAIVGTLSALILQQFQTSPQLLSISYAVNTATLQANAFNDTTVNALTLTLTGSYAWISASNPLGVTVCGNVITTYATNTAYAASTASGCQGFSTTSTGSSQTLSASTGNFYSFSSFTLSGVPSSAAPSLTAVVTQPYLGTKHNGVPASNSVNSLAEQAIATVTQNGAYNATQDGLLGVQTLTQYLPLIALTIVAAVLIGIVLVAFAFGSRGGGERF